jgi:hypothetical protein
MSHCSGICRLLLLEKQGVGVWVSVQLDWNCLMLRHGRRKCALALHAKRAYWKIYPLCRVPARACCRSGLGHDDLHGSGAVPACFVKSRFRGLDPRIRSCSISPRGSSVTSSNPQITAAGENNVMCLKVGEWPPDILVSEKYSEMNAKFGGPS